MQHERASTSHVILCFNSGSSSVKFALYRLEEVEEVRLAHGAVERIGLAGGHLWIRGTDNAALVDSTVISLSMRRRLKAYSWRPRTWAFRLRSP